MKRVAFLMYHELEIPGRTLCDDDPGYVRYVVTEATFRAQIARLRASGLRGVSVGDALAATRSEDRALSPEDLALGREPPSRVAVTFDDGAETDLFVAAPALREAAFGATFYVTVEHLGRRGFLSEPQLRELSDLGFEIGSHSLTHRYLHDLETHAIRVELADSKKRLEDVTGRPVRHFSCPGGRWDRRVAREARAAGYASLVTSVVGLNGPDADPFRLHRVAVMRGVDAHEIVRLASGRGLVKRRVTKAALDAAKRILGNARYDRLRAAALRRLRAR